MEASTPNIASSHFSTSALTMRDRFDAWEDGISLLFDVAPIEGTTDRGFDARLESYMVGSMIASLCRSQVQSFTRSRQTIARSGMDHVMVQLYSVGGGVIKTRDGFLRTRAGDIQILDLAQEVDSYTHGEGAIGGAAGTGYEYENVNLVIARDRLEPLLPSVADLHLAILRAGTPINLLIRNYILNLYQGAPTLSPAQADDLVQPTVELLAATLGRHSDIIDAARPTLNDAMLLSVKKYISANLSDPQLGPEHICRALGISRSALFRLCAPLGGIGAFIRHRRLLCARRLLCQRGSSASVKTVAYSLGFTNPSSFARAFKSQFGYSPREVQEIYRHAAQSLHERQAVPNIIPIGDRDYEYWVMNLVM